MKYLELVFNRPLEGSLSYLGIDDSPALGRRAYAMLGRKKLMGYVIGESSIPPDIPEHVHCRPIERFVDEEAVFTEELIDLARWISHFYICSLGEALAAMIPRGKKNRGLAFPDREPAPIELGTEQLAALNAITSGRSGNFYLYGITGSGKTEVFLRAAEKTLAEGRGVIYLVPEISLTHQLVDIIYRRFHTQAALLHSGLSPSQRIAQWRKILEGRARFVIGCQKRHICTPGFHWPHNYR